MALVTIGQTDLPSPSRYGLPGFDLDSADTRRNEEGRLQRDRVRQGVYKIELEWNGITGAELQTIETAIQPVSFQVTFIAPDGTKTKTMYAGDFMREILIYRSGDIRWNAAVNLIEI